MQDLNEIFDKARELAQMLLETEMGKALNDARFVYDGNEEAQKMLEEYSAFRHDLQNKVNNDLISEEELDKQNEILRGKIKELQANPIIKDLFTAEQNFNNVVSHAMNIFNATLAGDTALAGCGGSCATCGGCH